MKRLRKVLWASFVCLSLTFIFQSSHIVKADQFQVEDRSITLPKDKLSDKTPPLNNGAILNILSSDVTLSGLVDQAKLYYEIPIQGVGDDGFLHLNMTYSSLLLPDSTVTVSIDGHPVHSATIPKKKQSMTLDIPLEGDSAGAGYHEVTVSFYGSISENQCTDLDNPANWLTVSKESHIFLDVKELKTRENVLQQYPYPFIQSEQDEAIQGTIVIPDEPSTEILSAALKLANYLDRQTAENQAVEIIKESALKKVNTNIIAIGTPDQWEGLVNDLLISADFPIPKDELVLSNYFLEFPEITKQLLFVTANDVQVITDKINVLTEAELIEQLSGDYVAIDTVPKREKPEIKAEHAFEELGIPSLSLTGKEKMSTNYFYQLPDYVDVTADATLHLSFNVSETLFHLEDHPYLGKEDAELVVYINDVPHSIAVNDLKGTDKNTFYEVALPIDASILSESTFLSIRFQANGLLSNEICVPPNDEKWIYISDESYLNFALTETGLNDLSSWPAPFVVNGMSEATIILPDTYDEQLIQQVQYLVSSLGGQSSLNELNLIFEADVTEELLAGRHVIVIGGESEHPSLQKYAEDLLLQTEASNVIDVTRFNFLKETSQYAIWSQPSVWDKNKMMAVLAIIHPNDQEAHLSKQLIDYLTTNINPTNIVVENLNGDIFSQKIEEKEKIEQPSISFETESDKNITMWMLIGFVCIFVIAVILFIFLFQRRKRG